MSAYAAITDELPKIVIGRSGPEADTAENVRARLQAVAIDVPREERIGTFNGANLSVKGPKGELSGGGTNTGAPIFQGKKNWAAIVSFEKHWDIK